MALNHLAMFRFSIFGGVLAVGLILSIVAPSAGASTSLVLSQQNQQKRQVVITAMLDDLGNVIKWDTLLQPAIQELKARHPDLNIQINYTTTPYNKTRTHLLDALGNKSAIDLISVDQIWLGDFAERGYLTDLTDYVKIWGRASDWYQTNFDGGVYKGKVFGIWAWTDVRGMWYWKDLLNKAGVDPNSANMGRVYLVCNEN
jgi:multiple sugar transport system substrate-binding protein